MKHNPIFALAAALAILSVSTPAEAGSGMSPKQMEVNAAFNQLQHLDKKEIEMAKMAQNKAQSQEVKNLAEKMLREHQRLEKELKAAAKSENINMADYQLAGYEKSMMSDMEKLSGTQFEKTFVKHAKMAHEEAVKNLQSLQKRIDNKKFTNLVKTEYLPLLKAHRQMAANIKVQEQRAGQVKEKQ